MGAYHLPNKFGGDLIVTLLPKLRELENLHHLRWEGPFLLDKALNVSHYVLFVGSRWTDVVVLSLSRRVSLPLREDFVCAGRGSMNASAEVLPSPQLWRNRNNFF